MDKNTIENNKKIWQSLSDHVARGEEAEDLLLEIWLVSEQIIQLPMGLQIKLDQFFNHDDSE